MRLSSSSSLSAQESNSRQSETRTTQPKRKSLIRLSPLYQTLRRHSQSYLFLIPAILIFSLFVWYPIILGFVMSFQNVDLLGASTWIGWKNYQYIFKDPLFATAWRNSLMFTLYALLFGYAIPLILALVINEMRHARGFFRLAFYLPVMLPPIVTAFLWRWIYSPDGGLLNALLALIHIPSNLWLESTQTALPALMVVATWGAAGTTMLIYLAALQGVPASLYEAAEVDGANLWSRLWHITLPSIRPIMLLMLILQIIGTMQVFIEPFTITGGGPQNATMSLILLIYNYAFQQADFGKASALGAILFLVLALLALIHMRLTRNATQGD